MLPSSFSKAMKTLSSVFCPSGSVTLAWNGIFSVVEPVGISTELGFSPNDFGWRASNTFY